LVALSLTTGSFLTAEGLLLPGAVSRRFNNSWAFPLLIMGDCEFSGVDEGFERCRLRVIFEVEVFVVDLGSGFGDFFGSGFESGFESRFESGFDVLWWWWWCFDSLFELSDFSCFVSETESFFERDSFLADFRVRSTSGSTHVGWPTPTWFSSKSPLPTWVLSGKSTRSYHPKIQRVGH